MDWRNICIKNKWPYSHIHRQAHTRTIDIYTQIHIDTDTGFNMSTGGMWLLRVCTIPCGLLVSVSDSCRLCFVPVVWKCLLLRVTFMSMVPSGWASKAAKTWKHSGQSAARSQQWRRRHRFIWTRRFKRSAQGLYRCVRVSYCSVIEAQLKKKIIHLLIKSNVEQWFTLAHY